MSLSGCGGRTPLLLGDQAAQPDEQATGGTSPVDPPEEPELCVAESYDYTSEPASVLLLVDRSGSMTESFGAGTRWSVVRDALFDSERGLVPTMEGTARFGLSFYTSLDGFAGGTCPMLAQQVIELFNTETLAEAFDTTLPEPDGDTPTGEAIQASLSVLLAAPPGPKYLVLLTDGEPDTCAVPDPQGGQDVSIAAAQAAFVAGVPVFTVGVSEDIQSEHLQQMANAGSGRRLAARYGHDDDAARPLRASDDPAELASQMVGALGDVRSCVIALEPAESDLDEGAARVTLDGRSLVAGRDFALRGWELELLGDACAEVQSDATTLVVEVPCAE